MTELYLYDVPAVCYTYKKFSSIIVVISNLFLQVTGHSRYNLSKYLLLFSLFLCLQAYDAPLSLFYTTSYVASQESRNKTQRIGENFFKSYLVKTLDLGYINNS